MESQHHVVEVVQRLSRAASMEEIMDVLAQAARDLTGADGISVVLRDGNLCHYVEENAISPLWKGRRFPMEECVSGMCMLSSAPLVIEDIYKDARVPHDVYRKTFVASLAMVPIRSGDPLGAIGAYWAEQHRADRSQLEILRALGDSAALAMANLQLIEALRDNNQRKDDFLAMLAHELRTPLAPVRNALALLTSKGEDEEVRSWAVRVMDRQTAHLGLLIDDLLDASRIASGQLSITRQRFDLNTLVTNTLEDRRGMAAIKALPLIVGLPTNPTWIDADPVRIAQALGNILDNAVKFTPAGQVRVDLKQDVGQKVASLSVSDTGIGIALALQSAIFQPFVQADKSLHRTAGGLGLGLSVAKGLIDLHDGRIVVRSNGEGEGSCFTITLPLSPEPAAVEVAPAKAAGSSGQYKVLVIEDNHDSADSMKMLLECFGYSVDVAYCGRTGLDAALSTQPDFILCDIGLPELDGYQVAQAIRAEEDMQLTPLIAVTGYGAEVKDRVLGSGFNAHLVKPVDPMVLQSLLSSLEPG